MQTSHKVKCYTHAQAETFSPTPIHKILTLITLHIVFAVSQGV